MIIGLDIGASKIDGVVLNGKKTARSLTARTPKGLIIFKQTLQELIVELSQRGKIRALGAGIPGMVDKNGRVVYAPNMKFLAHFRLKDFFKTLGFRRVAIENDANCFALAEARLGRGKNFEFFFGITLGTGIGGGIIAHRKIYHGFHGSAGEVGHMMADENHDYEQLFQQYRSSRSYREMGKLLGRLFADVYNLLDIPAIIIGGSVAKSASQFLPSAIREARKHTLNRQISPKILVSKLKNAGALGAALLV